MEKKQPNKWGVYEDLDCERLAIPLNKKHKSGLLICVVCASDGLWRFGYSCAIKTSGQSSAAGDKGPAFSTREAAIVAGINKLSAIVSNYSDLTTAETKVYLDALEKFSLEFPLSEEISEQSAPPEPEQPLQAEKPRPQKTAYICGWMSTDLPDRPSAQLYVYKHRNDWGVTYDPSEASRFKSVEAVLDWYRANGSVHGDPEINSYNGYLKIFEDGPFGLRPVPRPTRQGGLFDNLPSLEIVEKQPDLITVPAAVSCFSRDENKLLDVGYILVRYDRDLKTIQRSHDNSAGWAPALPFATYAAAERTLKEMLQMDNVVEVSLEGKVNLTTCRNKLLAAGFDFYRSEGDPGNGIVPRIKQGSTNWSTWGRYEHRYELKNAWDLLMEDEKALVG